MHILCFIFCFFKQKTAYEMRISDWSSDVCSSDLARALANQPFYHGCANAAAAASHDCYLARQTIHYLLSRLSLFQHIAPLHFGQRLWRYEAASDKDDLSNERWRINSMACFRFHGLVPVIDPKIGRASRRERV